MKISSYLTLFVLLFASTIQFSHAQDKKNTNLELELHGGYTSNGVVPFWMRSNQYGSVPLDGGSGSFVVRANKTYRQPGEWQGRKTDSISLWDWGYGLEARTNVGREINLQLIDAHAKVRFAMFEVKAGRSKDVMGLNGDTLLTSGNFSVSGNALGVPKIDISIPEYYRLPWFGGLFSFKGNFANGYMGKMEIDKALFADQNSDTQQPTFLHQKSLYGRLAKPHWKLELYGGFNHQAQWGSEREVYGSKYELSFIESLFHVAVGKAYGGGGSGVPRSKVGNHQGSLDLGASYNFGAISIMAYRQNFYDVGALSKLANIKDGLNGITLTNNQYKQSDRLWDWDKVLVELFYSKDQAGYPWSKPTKSGDEDYYNNFFYTEGWSYLNKGMGSPLIITAHTASEGQISYPKEYFISNRVVAGHIGFSGHIHKWNLLTKLTYAKHYGTFSTSEYGGSLGQIRNPPAYGIFTPVSQFSAIVQGERLLSRRLYIGGTLGLDQGKLLDNSLGLALQLRKTF
ncbi:capsule assembly Wzi family protein [Sphingobacterium alkalisoli]|uniref:Capsule assembly Wzi family protein n=1 Tax=Sphingobacterium alkalisoli TaxID=1874115 RepID=A0A4U0GMX4_9SPHI|nr:capsule assembly Wzi family protein [Sphingobacterium alkalisoli]TJY60098.1 capsule assembly Wzi family protein [Sphingobacterium alkalisoli]GGH32880.1 hypothetical protein GCM10011418_46710 [Sphingobacterium alkalisoli]